MAPAEVPNAKSTASVRSDLLPPNPREPEIALMIGRRRSPQGKPPADHGYKSVVHSADGRPGHARVATTLA